MTARAQFRISPLLLLLMVFPTEVLAERSCPPICDLESLQEIALENSPRLDEREAAIEYASAQFDEVRFAVLDQGSFRLDVSPTPSRRGDIATYEQGDIWSSSTMGLWARIRLKYVLAITPWWRIVEYWRAARHNRTMREHERDQARAELLLEIEEAYRAVQMADATAMALRYARVIVVQALEYVEQSLDEDMGDVVESDRLRLIIVRSDLEAQRIQALQARRRAVASLYMLVGLGRNIRLRVPPMEDAGVSPHPLEWLLETAQHYRPEVQLSAAGIRAARAMVRVRQAEFVPDLGMGIAYSFCSAPVVDDQHNAYVSDPFNGGVGIGYGLALEWQLAFGVFAARLGQARADLRLAQQLRRYALAGVAYEVEQAYVNHAQDAKDYEERQQSLEVARRRLDTVVADQLNERASAEDLARAVNDWVNQRVGAIRARGQLHQSRTRLAAATGSLGQSRLEEDESILSP